MAVIDVTPGLAPLGWVPALPAALRVTVLAITAGATACLVHAVRRRARPRS
jgi:hypothetical protein